MVLLFVMVGTVEDNAVTAMETKKINANDTKLFIISEIHNRLLTCMASLNLPDLIRISQRNTALIKLIGWKLHPANPLIQIFCLYSSRLRSYFFSSNVWISWFINSCLNQQQVWRIKFNRNQQLLKGSEISYKSSKRIFFK